MSADLDALAPELARLDVLIEAEILRMRARYELSLDELHGLYISDERVEALLKPEPAAGPRHAPDVAAVRQSDTGSRWHQLAAALELTDDERDLLLVSLAPELDPKYETVYGYLNDDVTRRWPTIDLAVRLVAGDPAHRVQLRGLLLPGATLSGLGALELSPKNPHELRVKRMLRPAPGLADWVQGLVYADERITGIATFGPFGMQIPESAIPAASRAALDGLVVRFRDRVALPPIVLAAARPPEATVIAEDLFARAKRLALMVDLAALRTAPAPAEVVAAIALAQRLLQVGIVASPLDALLEADGRPGDACVPAIRRLAHDSPALVFGTGAGVRARDLLGDVPTIDITLPEPSSRERAAAWRSALSHGPHAIRRPPKALVEAVADRFTFGIDRIIRAATAAKEAASLEGVQPSSAHVFAAARALSIEGSRGTTRTITNTFGWDDLILPIDTKVRLGDIVHAIERRPRVLDDWDFARRVGAARGVTVMFAGPSGTGKTMAAAIVAKQLQLELHRLELGAVVSKYIGETEKNLDLAFESARRANAVLFIDEADALLGKRSQVKDAHDRYANVEIAYLLQKVDDHDGIVIVATNLARNIDESFARRMHYVVEFPLPDAPSRELLWRGMFPASAPVSDDVDFTFLGRQFELAGGDIRNVVLDAAYRAAQDDAEITLRHVLRAVARQYAKRGQVPTQADFREHYRLLVDGDTETVPTSVAPAH